MSIIRKIKDYYKKQNSKKNILFTTPSHAQGSFIPPVAREMLGEKFFGCDFSEIEGFDNLRNPEGILKELQEKLSKIYHSKQTFMLTNGSTSGIIALMLSVIHQGEKVLIARNCHISVYNGLVLTGAKPVWFVPEFDEKWGIYKGVTAEEIDKALTQNKDIKALIITSPTYEGTFSDIAGISKICKNYGIILIVDEAHGALLNFANLGAKPAILDGADASVQSLHKTAGAPNPCALIHLSENSKIKANDVQKALNLINTTSPSYPLMLAIESCVDFLASNGGKSEIESLLKNIESLKKSAHDNISFYEKGNDKTKLLVRIENVSGYDACEVLNKKYFIEEEFSNDRAMLFVTGLGTTKEALDRLAKALNTIKENSDSSHAKIKFEYTVPEQKMTPREASFSKDTVTLPSKSAAGRISAEVVTAYPPGIPLILPGETITEDILKKANVLAQKTKFNVISDNNHFLCNE